MRTSLVLVLALMVGISAAHAAPSDRDLGIRVFESRDDSAITHAETVIDIDPDAAYQAVADYGRWSTIFPDIRRVVVTKQLGSDARVTLIHAAGNRDNVHFRNQPLARMVWFEDTGGRAKVWAEIVFAPGDRPGTTHVRSRIYADVPGFASLFVSDAKLRRLRQQRIRDDLSNLRAYFARIHDGTLTNGPAVIEASAVTPRRADPS